MKKLTLFIFVILLTFLFFRNADAQTKRVLLEQHTGAWCGWCVDGTFVMDQILELYGDQVIGVKIHGGGDAMQIPEQSEIGSVLGLTGFPSGTVDRKDFGGSVGWFLGNLHR